MFGRAGPQLGLERVQAGVRLQAQVRYNNAPGQVESWQVLTPAGWQVAVAGESVKLAAGAWYRISIEVDFFSASYTHLRIAGQGQDIAVDLGQFNLASEATTGADDLAVTLGVENACGSTVHHAVYYDDLRVRPRQYLMHDMKDWLLAHAPCKQYRPATGGYLPFGGTPGAACESIRFLRTYHALAEWLPRAGADPRPEVASKLVALADWVLQQQHGDSTHPHFGGFASAPDFEGFDNYYYSIDAAFCGDALLEAYDLTGDERYKQGAIAAALFLRRMQNPLDPLDPGYDAYSAAFMTQDDQGSPHFFGGAMEYYLALGNGTGAYNNSMHSKLLLGWPFLSKLAEVDGTFPYAAWATELRDFLLTGLEEGQEYFVPSSPWLQQPYGWHRVADTDPDMYVYEDSMAYGIRALHSEIVRTGADPDGLLPVLRQAYETYNGCSHGNPDYNPDIAWTGYLMPGESPCSTASDSASGKLYYDLSGAGILGVFRSYEYPAAGDISGLALQQHPYQSMYWATGFNWEMTFVGPTPGDPPQTNWQWQDSNAIANIGEFLVKRFFIGGH